VGTARGLPAVRQGPVGCHRQPRRCFPVPQLLTLSSIHCHTLLGFLHTRTCLQPVHAMSWTVKVECSGRCCRLRLAGYLCCGTLWPALVPPFGGGGQWRCLAGACAPGLHFSGGLWRGCRLAHAGVHSSVAWQGGGGSGSAAPCCCHLGRGQLDGLGLARGWLLLPRDHAPQLICCRAPAGWQLC
jgi:hypothetical protein